MTDTNNKTQTGALHLDDSNFDQTLTDAGDKPVLVDFYADWCGPCQMAAPIIEKLAEEYADKAVVAKVDVDSQQQLAARYGVMSIPTVIVFKNNEPVSKQTGFAGEAGYKNMLDKAM